MNILRRAIFFVSLVTFLVSIIVLLNFTAPNPTGRRYSSEIPALNSRGRDGSDAERILSLDLGVPQNTITSPRQCICNTQYANNPPTGCDVCTVSNQSVGTWNVPDFVTDSFIAEAKNYAPYSEIYSSNRQQLDNFIAMANYLHRPLWLYVAVDSRVSPEFQYTIEQTGGGVVFYFTTVDYVDSVDDGTRKVAFGSIFIVGIFVVTEISTRRHPRGKTPQDTASRAHQSTKTAEEFARRAKERIQIKTDFDDE